MSFTITPDLLSFQMRSRTNSVLRARMQTVSLEAVTGQRSDVISAIRGQAGQAHLLSKAINDVDQNRLINNMSSTRVQMLSNTIASIRTSTNGLEQQALVAINSGNSDTVARTNVQALSALESVFTAMNVKQGSRYLMSGNKTDTPPLTDVDSMVTDIRNILSVVTDPSDAELALDFYFYNPAGGFSTSIYSGGDKNQSPLILDNDSSIPIEIRADNTEFRDIMYGLSIMATIDSVHTDFESDAYRTIYQNAVSRLGSGGAATIEMEGRLGMHSQRIENYASSLNAETIVLNESYLSIFGRDQFEAAAELKQLEVQLEASYAVTARLSNLTLANFLR